MSNVAFEQIRAVLEQADDETLGWIVAHTLAELAHTDSVGGMEWNHRVQEEGGLREILTFYAQSLREAAERVEEERVPPLGEAADRIAEALNAAEDDRALGSVVYGAPFGSIVDREKSDFFNLGLEFKHDLVTDRMRGPPYRVVLLDGSRIERAGIGEPWEVLTGEPLRD